MKKVIYISTIFLITILSFCQCSTIPKFETKPPIEFQDTYYQKWTAGVQEGGSGINLYIKAKDTVSMVLDSVYFRGKVAKLQVYPNSKNLYVARFIIKSQKLNDVTISNNPKEEISNTIDLNTTKIPFQLEINECVVSYQSKGETLYYKISKLREKNALKYPSLPPSKH